VVKLTIRKIMEQVFAEIKQSVEKEIKQTIDRAKRVADREIQHAKEKAESILNANKEKAEKLAKIRTEMVKSPIMPQLNHPVTLSANIHEISYSSGFPTLILEFHICANHQYEYF